MSDGNRASTLDTSPASWGWCNDCVNSSFLISHWHGLSGGKSVARNLPTVAGYDYPLSRDSNQGQTGFQRHAASSSVPPCLFSVGIFEEPKRNIWALKMSISPGWWPNIEVFFHFLNGMGMKWSYLFSLSGPLAERNMRSFWKLSYFTGSKVA